MVMFLLLCSHAIDQIADSPILKQIPLLSSASSLSLTFLVTLPRCQPLPPDAPGALCRGDVVGQADVGVELHLDLGNDEEVFNLVVVSPPLSDFSMNR